MHKIIAALAAIPFALTFSAPAIAEDAMAMELPAACETDAGMAAMSAMPADQSMGHTANLDEAHGALMMGMGKMNSDMMMGAMAPDFDVAFVCGMIPHHMGAISMAQAELKYGKDEWTKQMAQKVIDAQTQEIADMTKWLEEHAK